MTNKITKILGGAIAFAGALIAMGSGKDTKAETTTPAVSNNSTGGEGKNETEIINEPEEKPEEN